MDYQKLYKFSKKDHLDKLAKTWGHKSAKDIWDDPLNKSLKRKYKTFDKIQPGDKVYIPYTAKHKKLIIEKTLHYLDLIDGEVALGKMYSERCTHFLKAGEIASNNAKATIKIRADLEKSLRGTAKHAKATMKAVDIAAEVLLVLAGLGKTGAKASKASGAELTKLNKEAMSIISGIPGTKLINAAKNAGLKHLMKQDNVIGQAAGALFALEESFANLTSPGFWAKTIAGLEEGKTWYGAINFDLDQGITNRLNIADRTLNPAIQKAIIKAKEAIKASKECTNSAKGTLDRIKIYEKEKTKLPIVV